MLSTIPQANRTMEGRSPIDRACFAAIFSSLGPLAFYAPKGMWIPILLFLLVRLKILASLTFRDIRHIAGCTVPYLMLPGYAVLSASWALVPENAVTAGAKLLGCLIAAIAVVVVVDRLSDDEKRSILIWSSVGLAAACIAVWLDLATAGAISALFRERPYTSLFHSPGAVIAACAVLPVVVGLWRLAGSRPAIVTAVICVATVFVLQNEAAKLAAVLALLVYSAVRWRGALFWPAILLPLAIGLIFPAFFVNGVSDSTLCNLYHSKPSAAHRLVIYEFVSRRIFEKPLLGWGMDASRSMPGGKTQAFIRDCEIENRKGTVHKLGAFLPLHPHNAALQVWLELGAAGVALFLGLLGALIVRCRREIASRNGQALLAGLLASIFVIYNIGFGLWQSWLIFALIIVSAIVRALPLSGRPADDGFPD